MNAILTSDWLYNHLSRNQTLYKQKEKSIAYFTQYQLNQTLLYLVWGLVYVLAYNVKGTRLFGDNMYVFVQVIHLYIYSHHLYFCTIFILSMLQLVGRFRGATQIYTPTQGVTIVWPKGLPIDMPTCGYAGELCINKPGKNNVFAWINEVECILSVEKKERKT